ncbi:aminotransferase class I/II-fold pyridoxal phosphate-dependent enzyme [Pedobacter sp. Leaf170]|uniref:aminotransferase class I/II-fold pyridoxal phosphate-dependent enzyme n=1 Tax=Pedobacter sp. Leaf170 TaxID=2876558 RepID=UPI001E3BE8BE|nr:aminotransferase class I/II-fold pyridoxal phosphate-dependent enzyme [Pedobacter sp. Leaf170]
MNLDFTEINQPFSNTIQISGKNYLYFGGTAYLGIPQNKAFINLYVEGIKKFGLNNGTSRSNNIQLGIYKHAEAVAAQRFGSEAALITSSGYLAAQLTVNQLAAFGTVIYAPSTHPALWVENQINHTNKFVDWSIETVELINSSPKKNWVLISNSMNNIMPEIYDFNFLNKVDKDKSIILIVDDSHGIGVNNEGLGAYSALPKLANVENVVVASMAKALGVDAGIVLGSASIIEQLKRTNTFVGASPPAAAGLYAFVYAEEIYQKAIQKLYGNISIFEKGLISKCDYAKNFPAFLFHNTDFANQLLNQQILISSFPYPGTNNLSINRVIISSWHTEDQINMLLSAIS